MSWYWDKTIIVPLGISPQFHLSLVLVIILGHGRMEEFKLKQNFSSSVYFQTLACHGGRSHDFKQNPMSLLP